MKKSVVGLIISCSVGFLIFMLWIFGSFESLENKVMDSHFKIRGDIKPSADIVIISIDEDSVNKLGRWPWPRSIHAKVIDKLNAAGAKSIVFDVLFTEDDKDRPYSDQELGKAAKKSGNVVFGSFFNMGANG